MKRLFGLIAFSFAASGCLTTMLVKQEQDNPKVRTIGLDVGEWGADRMYVPDFQREADKQCAQGYTVLERTRTPSTLKKDLIEPGAQTFYWVIKCK